MADSAHQKTAHGNVDHGFGDVDASFVVAHEAAPASGAHHFDDEIEENGLAQQLPTIVGAVGEKMLDPWPALADSAPNRLLGRMIAWLGARRICLWLSTITGARAGFAPGPLAVIHQGDVVDRAKQHQPYKAPEPPVDRLPGRKVLREHPPAAALARNLADRVENLAQVNALPTFSLGWFRQQSAPIPHWRDRSDYASSSARFGPFGLASRVSTT